MGMRFGAHVVKPVANSMNAGAADPSAMTAVSDAGATKAFAQAPRLAPQQKGLNGIDGEIVIDEGGVGQDPDPRVSLQMLGGHLIENHYWPDHKISERSYARRSVPQRRAALASERLLTTSIGPC